MKFPVNTLMMLANVVIMICVCMEFFVKKEEGEETEEATEKTEKSESAEDEGETEIETKKQYDAAMLRGWFAIEVLMFTANICSNIVFVLARACSRIRILGTRTSAVVNSNTDMIEEQQVLLSLFSSFIAPLIVSFCLQAFGFDSYPELTNAVWEWLFILLILQIVQSVIVIYITFMPYRRSD